MNSSYAIERRNWMTCSWERVEKDVTYPLKVARDRLAYYEAFHAYDYETHRIIEYRIVKVRG